ncbi:MAG: hypothetical protein ACYCYI_09465 [Saccharofermentanales bacterium]
MAMPSIPVSIFIDKEIKIIENKMIKDAKCELIYEGRYSWHGASFDNLNEIVGSRIESLPCAGTRMYFCPKCQIIKK